jgi:hypothetical protein
MSLIHVDIGEEFVALKAMKLLLLSGDGWVPCNLLMVAYKSTPYFIFYPCTDHISLHVFCQEE